MHKLLTFISKYRETADYLFWITDCNGEYCAVLGPRSVFKKRVDCQYYCIFLAVQVRLHDEYQICV